MPVDSDSLGAFRKQVSSARSLDADCWEASRHLIHPADWPATRKSLIDAIQTSSIPDGLKQDLVAALPTVLTTEERTSSAVLLKQLDELEAMPLPDLLEQRYKRLRSYGAYQE